MRWHRRHGGGRALLPVLLAAMFTTPAAGAATAYVSSEQAGIAVIDLDRLEVTHTWATGGKGARGLGISADGAHLLAANRDTGDLSVIDARSGKVLRRVPIGKNPEFVRVLGDEAFVTYEPAERPRGPSASAPSAPPGKAEADAEPPAEIAVVDLRTWQVKRVIPSGRETEGIEFSPDGRLLLVTNEGDDTVTVYERASGKRLRLIRMPEGSRPRGIKISPDGRQYVVTLEETNALLVLDAGDYRVLRTVPTRKGPYGVAFDRAGKRLFVAASRADTLQVFDANTYESLADIAVGKRCWHFSFTPDDARLLVACGRSNTVYVLDAQNYQVVRQIEGIGLNWGVVSYPKSAGSIDAR